MREKPIAVMSTNLIHFCEKHDLPMHLSIYSLQTNFEPSNIVVSIFRDEHNIRIFF